MVCALSPAPGPSHTRHRLHHEREVTSTGVGALGWPTCRATPAETRGTPRAFGVPPVEQLLDIALHTQASVAIGLVRVTPQRFHGLAPAVTVVLGAMIVFEIIGPFSARFALGQSCESRPQEATELLPLDTERQ